MRESAIATANSLNGEYWEVSAQSSTNVHEFFTRVAAVCFDEAVLRELDMSTQQGGQVEMGGGGITLSNPSKKETIVLGDGGSPKGGIGGYYDQKPRSKCCK